MPSCWHFLLLKATGSIHSCLLGLPDVNSKMRISLFKNKPCLRWWVGPPQDDGPGGGLHFGACPPHLLPITCHFFDTIGMQGLLIYEARIFFFAYQHFFLQCRWCFFHSIYGWLFTIRAHSSHNWRLSFATCLHSLHSQVMCVQSSALLTIVKVMVATTIIQKGACWHGSSTISLPFT